MTKEMLEQYPDLCAEIREVTEQMRRSPADSLTESEAGFPWHFTRTGGVPADLFQRREELQRQKAEIEGFVASLPNSSLRRVVTYRGLQGRKWADVAAKMGGRYSERRAKYLYNQAVQYRPWEQEREKTETEKERED